MTIERLVKSGAKHTRVLFLSQSKDLLHLERCTRASYSYDNRKACKIWSDAHACPIPDNRKTCYIWSDARARPIPMIIERLVTSGAMHRRVLFLWQSKDLLHLERCTRAYYSYDNRETCYIWSDAHSRNPSTTFERLVSFTTIRKVKFPWSKIPPT
jgi:hypothetical protein